MTGDEIRNLFLSYFEGKGHCRVPSSSLVPAGDSTLLFANAGMNQFKDVFLGAEKRSYSRATSVQKCVRAGGKHNDLENVGRTRRHHTFFEMLGNFSFGDYFKEDAIAFSWELVTKVFGLPESRLFVTVFREDDEAERLWKKVANLGANRIHRCGEKDNFWQMGETGPCGPCSEIFYDYGPEGLEPEEEDAPFPAEISRYMEIWNLVFMQFERDVDGRLHSLPKPSIDTGMGLERIAAVIQGKRSNFHTDLFLPIIEKAGDLLGMNYGEESHCDIALRIVADHSRAATFLVNDGVLPSNEGRGYVLRKIIRRALRHARMAGFEDVFFYKLTDHIANLMSSGYPELKNSAERVGKIIHKEEMRYYQNFAVAEREFETAASQAVDGTISGALVFRLYDTFGLSIDEQLEMANERSLRIDIDGYELALGHQRSRARASWKGSQHPHLHMPLAIEFESTGRTEFLGYSEVQSQGLQVVAILQDGQPVEAAKAGSAVQLQLDRTPFYAESGGQLGDSGILLIGETEVALVRDVQAIMPGVSLHSSELLEDIAVGAKLDGRVNKELRDAIRRNHTATHLLHAALRKVLGSHAKQAGSVVAPDRLRFDFTHYAPLETSEIDEIEDLVNDHVLRDLDVVTETKDLDRALGDGAMALFGEKYLEQVRVVSVGDFSKELCGGTHVARTGEIGLCRIVSEGSSAAGVRRLEALTGRGVLRHCRLADRNLGEVMALLRVGDLSPADSVRKLLDEKQMQDREMKDLKNKLAQASVADLVRRAQEIDGLRVIAAKLDDMDRSQLRLLADTLRIRIGTGVVVLATVRDSRVVLVAAATKDVAGRKVHAGRIVRSVAQLIGGRGGGRPDIAEAGGKNSQALPDALGKVFGIVKHQLQG